MRFRTYGLNKDGVAERRLTADERVREMDLPLDRCVRPHPFVDGALAFAEEKGEKVFMPLLEKMRLAVAS